MQLEEFVASTPQFKQIQAGLHDGGRQLVTGVGGSAKTALLATIQQNSKTPQVVVCDSLFHMQSLAADLENLLPETAVYQFTVEESLAMEISTS